MPDLAVKVKDSQVDCPPGRLVRFSDLEAMHPLLGAREKNAKDKTTALLVDRDAASLGSWLEVLTPAVGYRVGTIVELTSKGSVGADLGVLSVCVRAISCFVRG